MSRADGREAPFFDDRERAALALTDAVTRLGDHGVPDDVWDEVVKHWSAEEITNLSRQAISQVAASLFQSCAADRVIAAGMPKVRAAMHRDTVVTFADVDCVTVFRDIVDSIHPYTIRPGDGPRAST